MNDRGSIEMIKSMSLIPSTPTSHPFAQAAIKCDFEAHGWVEEEWFFSGTANLYEEDANGIPQAFFMDALYTNRLLVRRPADPARFSGNIVVEILNPSARIDIDRMWVCAWKSFMREGDIYIGVTSKPDVLNSLYTADPERYAPIRWDNPLPDRPLPENNGPFPILPEHETGLFWDMLTDLSRLLRTTDVRNPVRDFLAAPSLLRSNGRPWLYLTGWSQSGGYMVRFRQTFANLPEHNVDGPLFDGWLEAGAGSIPCPIHSFSPAKPFFSTPEGFRGRIVSREPYIAVNTETENEHTRWTGDSTVPGQLFRCYEISGSSHDSKYNLVDWYTNDPDIAKRGHKPEFYGMEPYPNDYPYEFLFSAAFRNLFVWVREGVPAPASLQIPIGLDGKNQKDALGNTRGGVRTPFIDLPTCVYSKYCTPKDAPTTTRDFFGHIVPFTGEKMQTLYGSLAYYRELAAARTDEIIAEGYLLAADREAIIETAVGFARERGLTD